MTPEELQDFETLAHAEPNTGCWLWVGTIAAGGYPRFKRSQAHRVSYLHYIGAIAPKMHVDHRCRVRCCVNPDHLEAMTQRENAKRTLPGMRGKHSRSLGRGVNSAKTECPYGHPYAGDNLYITPSTGSRMCRICMRARARASYAEHGTASLRRLTRGAT